jgi:hypothetical protein
MAGLSDATLLVLERRPSSSSSGSGSGSSISMGEETGGSRWVAKQTLREFAEKRILQLCLAPLHQMLLCLDEEGVNAYTIPHLTLKGQAARTRGAAAFAWNDSARLLCVAVKRRLLLFHYDRLEFVAQREISLPDRVQSMALAGETTLYLGLRGRDYATVDLTTGALTSPLALGSAAKTHAAVAVPVPPSEVLLLQGSSALQMGTEGRPARGRRAAVAVAFDAPPLALACSGPYVAAVLPDGIQVKLLGPLSSARITQVIPLPGVDVVAPSAAADGSLFVACRVTGAVHRLALLPYLAQAEQMLGHGEYEEALSMCSLVSQKLQVGGRRLCECMRPV